ncbi:MAG: tRNA adenosine(34) deaminase TadA [Phycisphaerales bacterium]
MPRLGAAPSRRPPPLRPGPFDDAMMRRALDLAARAADAGDVPVGAVVFDSQSGAILGEGLNTREAQNDPTGHAEVVAIRAAARRLGDWRLNDCTLVVTLEPCAMCAGAVVNARVGRLVFGASDPKAGCATSLMRLTQDPRLNHRVAPISGVLAAQSADMLRRFFQARRGTK